MGGCVRDLLRGVEPADWDLATDARPERLQELFPSALYENRFGTVAVEIGDETYEVTTYRHDGPYSDHRRPDAVIFGTRLDDDLARRDFTVNAMALAIGEEAGADEEAGIRDPFGGRADLAAGILRAVGDPAARFREDSLRMLRAVRFAATLGFAVEPQTLAAIEAAAPLAAPSPANGCWWSCSRCWRPRCPRWVSGSPRRRACSPRSPRSWPGSGACPRHKVPGEDLWDHTCRTVDAAPRPLPDEPPLLRLAALLHDIGKPATFADGHFVGHETVGASLAGAWLTELHAPRFLTGDTVNLVRHHMFAYDAGWTDAAVRRFIRRCGASAIEDLLDLRAADNVGSGLAPDTDGLESLRARCREQLEARVALDLAGLAVNGDDLMEALEIPAGPALGRLLDRLLEMVLVDPMLNDRSRLLTLARELAASDSAESGPGDGPRDSSGPAAGAEPT